MSSSITKATTFVLNDLIIIGTAKNAKVVIEKL